MHCQNCEYELTPVSQAPCRTCARIDDGRIVLDNFCRIYDPEIEAVEHHFADI